MSDSRRLYDLHVHSVRSDGVCSPMQLADLARRSGLAGLAITDHDTLPVADELFRLEQRFAVRMIIGVELSAVYYGLGLHLLGYDVDPADASLSVACESIRAARRERRCHMIDSLAKRGIKLKQAAMLEPQSPGRLHLARELVASGHASSIKVAFERYLTPLSKAAPIDVLPLEEGIRLIHGAGGTAVLAHPPPTWTEAHFADAAALGVDGIETAFPSAPLRRQRWLKECARSLDLVATAGSDYHGDERRSALGRFTVEEPVANRLVRHAGHSNPKSGSASR